MIDSDTILKFGFDVTQSQKLVHELMIFHHLLLLIMAKKTINLVISLVDVQSQYYGKEKGKIQLQKLSDYKGTFTCGHLATKQVLLEEFLNDITCHN